MMLMMMMARHHRSHRPLNEGSKLMRRVGKTRRKSEEQEIRVKHLSFLEKVVPSTLMRVNERKEIKNKKKHAFS